MTENAKAMIRDRVKKLKCSHKSTTLYQCNQGATAVEYAIILALIAAVIFAAVSSLGSAVNNLFVSASQGW
jgi:Flp pilus assembly pilin Flp